MDIRIDGDALREMLPIFFGVLVLFTITIWILYYIIKQQDSKKKLVTQKVKVIEKISEYGGIAWYVVECANGKRLKLRTFKANSLLIAVGDIGIVGYRGQTIYSFQRQK